MNPAKTQFMCVSCKDTPVITYGNKEVKRAHRSKYLGLEFMENGKVCETKKEAFKKALKVYFKLIKSFHPITRSSTLTHIFKHLVKRVLNYGCEIWFPGNILLSLSAREPVNDVAAFFKDLKQSHPIPSRLLSKDECMEKLHLRFLKFCLGLHPKASNMAVYGDLGRYPLYIEQCIQSLK